MKPTKKQLKEIQEIEKKVAEVCDTKKTTVVTRNEDGVIINTETGKPHFEELLELNNKKVVEELNFSISYGYDAPSIKTQLIEQGLKFDKHLIVKSELIRNQILSLNAIGILNKKGTSKALYKLNDYISQTIADNMCKENQIAIRVQE